MTVNHQRIFITGASSGIGRELACQLAPQAHQIWLCGRNANELTKTQQAMRAINPNAQVHCIAADLTLASDRERVLRLLTRAELDLVILNAGGGNFGMFVDSHWPDEEKVITLNISSTVHLARALLPQLLKSARQSSRRAGLIIVSSHAAFMRIPHFSVYASCKAFLNSFALTLRQELKNEPIDILLVNPGATRTQFSERAEMPPKMLSTPDEPDAVARQILRALGHRSFLIVNRLDKALYLVSRFLPISFFDYVVARLQIRLLKKVGYRGRRTKTPKDAAS